MKNKLKPDFIPKWVQNIYKVMHKENGVWVHWKIPSPTKDPNLSNHERLLKQREERAKLKT